METPNWTPEPWTANFTRYDGGVEGFHIAGFEHGSSYEICGFVLQKGDNPSEAEANARRIVACVNACEGISTEDLEHYPGMPHGAVMLTAERDQLRSQNAELVEAAVLLLGQYDASGDFKMGGKLTNEPFLKFRHVLAKVT